MKIRVAIYDGNPVCNNQKQVHTQEPSQPSQPSHVSQPCIVNGNLHSKIDKDKCLEIFLLKGAVHEQTPNVIEIDVSHDEAKAYELYKQPKTTQTSHPAKAPFKRRTKHTHDKIK